MKTTSVRWVTPLLIIFSISLFFVSNVYASEQAGIVLKGEVNGPQITQSLWVASSKNKASIYFTLTNNAELKQSGSYRLAITRMEGASSGKLVYTKTAKIKDLGPRKDKKISIALNKKPLLQKLHEGSYNVELFINDEFMGSVVLSVSSPASRTATLSVSTLYDGTYLPAGAALPIYADITGNLPQGGTLWFGIATRDSQGLDGASIKGEKVLPAGFTGRVTFNAPYYGTSNGKTFSHYSTGKSHYAFVKLFKGAYSASSVSIAEKSSSAWFYTQ